MTGAFDTFMGGAKRFQTISADLTLPAVEARVVIVNPTSTGYSVHLPDARKLVPGGPHFYVANVGSQLITLKDNAGGTVVSLASGKTAIVCLAANASQAGAWVTVTRTTVRAP